MTDTSTTARAPLDAERIVAAGIALAGFFVCLRIRVPRQPDPATPAATGAAPTAWLLSIALPTFASDVVDGLADGLLAAAATTSGRSGRGSYRRRADWQLGMQAYSFNRFTFEEAVAVWLMKWAEETNHIIAAKLGINQGRIAEVLNEKLQENYCEKRCEISSVIAPHTNLTDLLLDR